MFLITLVVITLLCLVFASTRIYAVIGTGLLLFLYPFLTIGFLFAAGIAYYYYQEKTT
jgi:hypothetical protein